jgi:transcription termination/antitermination protein NusA
VVFVTNGLSPAKVQRVTIVDDAERVMEVVVEDKQLSLAIGKKGQNVRLAAKLTGWRIDIKSEEEKRREVEEQFGALGGDEPLAEEAPAEEAISAQPEQAGGGDTDETGEAISAQPEQPGGSGDAVEEPGVEAAEMETEKS